MALALRIRTDLGLSELLQASFIVGVAIVLVWLAFDGPDEGD